MNWTGRFSANFLDSFFGYLGPGATPYATGLVITAWFVILVVALVQIVPSDEERNVRWLESGIIAAIVLFGVLEVIPLIGQSLYWGQGMRSTVPPLILGTAYAGLIANRGRSTQSNKVGVGWIGTAFLLTLVAAGFAETHFAAQTTAIAFVLLISVIPKSYSPPNRSYLLLLIAGLAGSLAGGLLMFVAPGNRFRQSAFPPPPAPPELLSISFRGLREFFQLVFFEQSRGFIWAGLLLSGFIFGLKLFRQQKESARALRHHVWLLVCLPIVAFVLLLACWVPMAWGTSLTLTYRTMIIPAYILVGLLVCWAYVAGRLCESSLHLYARRTRGIAITVSLIGLVTFGLFAAVSSRKMWQLRSVFAGYARKWDEREALVQSAKSQDLSYAVVGRLHNWAALDEIAVDPKITWLTKCVQDYYGIGVIPDLGDLYGEPNGAAKQAELEHQFDLIPKLSGSLTTELNRIYKSDRGKIGFYKIEATPDRIKSYYENELAKLGWKYIGAKQVEAFGRFSGGTQNLFCNGDLSATLFITGADEPRVGYTYSFALNWGMSSGYVWGAADCPR